MTNRQDQKLKYHFLHLAAGLTLIIPWVNIRAVTQTSDCRRWPRRPRHWIDSISVLHVVTIQWNGLTLPKTKMNIPLINFICCSALLFSLSQITLFQWAKVLERRKRTWWEDRNHGNYGRIRLSLGPQFRMESGKDRMREKQNKRQNRSWKRKWKDWVPCGSGAKRRTGHYVEHWYRESGGRGPGPARPTGPSPGSASESPSLRFIPSRPWNARRPSHSRSPRQRSEFNCVCVSGENFSFWSVCVFTAVDSVSHCGPKKTGLTLQ